MPDGAAPALENGLTIVEMLSQAELPMRFGEILAGLSISKASAIRLLKVLRARGYVVKDERSGGYLPGPRLATLGRPGLEAETMRRASGRILEELSADAGSTALAIHFDGRRMQCLSKVVHQASAPMQQVGTIMLDLDGTPWGWVFYTTLNEASRVESHRHMHDAAAFKRRLKKRIAFYERKGFAYDDQTMFKSLRRLTAMVRDASGAIVGAVGIGGNPLTIPDGRVDALGKRVRRAADELSRAMGWAEPTRKK